MTAEEFYKTLVCFIFVYKNFEPYIKDVHFCLHINSYILLLILGIYRYCRIKRQISCKLRYMNFSIYSCQCQLPRSGNLCTSGQIPILFKAKT